MFASSFAERLVKTATTAAARGDDLIAALESLAAPIYLTVADGWITYFNKACAGFAGRTPALGKDRWCVTWTLYPDEGAALAHDACPMAVSIRSRRPIRGVTAIAERPGGERVHFMPLPTPAFGQDGGFAGAINILIDVTEYRQAAALREQAYRCRRLAWGMSDQAPTRTLSQMADE
jgi:PAS domain-containing protein